jgi:hypothetical protein
MRPRPSTTRLAIAVLLLVSADESSLAALRYQRIVEARESGRD